MSLLEMLQQPLDFLESASPSALAVYALLAFVLGAVSSRPARRKPAEKETELPPPRQSDASEPQTDDAPAPSRDSDSERDADLADSAASGSDASSGDEDDDDDECKLVLAVRADLPLSRAVAASACAGGTLACFRASLADPERHEVLAAWEDNGQPKITLRCNGEAEMMDLQARARERGLPARAVVDAEGRKTVLAIGPGRASVIDGVTGYLKLF
ncbi:peptidyl-tRNA hydrolase PTH2-domain-containing protein [Hyaloraphidium curvatum]|nr:peptidyl-tRNA hydrolase PTH2-domain-containing protein [Hyaloraphidium curvatum]